MPCRCPCVLFWMQNAIVFVAAAAAAAAGAVAIIVVWVCAVCAHSSSGYFSEKWNRLDLTKEEGGGRECPDRGMLENR